MHVIDTRTAHVGPPVCGPFHGLGPLPRVLKVGMLQGQLCSYLGRGLVALPWLFDCGCGGGVAPWVWGSSYRRVEP